jgi:hypothetical protein
MPFRFTDYLDGDNIKGFIVAIDGQNVHQAISAYYIYNPGSPFKFPKTEIAEHIKSIFGLVADKKMKDIQDIEFKLIFPYELDLLK